MAAPANTVITPPSTFAYAGPEIEVEIWPHNGGKYTFSGATNGILAAEVSKNIRDKMGGKFVLELAPGGPSGVNSSITWTSILTPASLVIISLARAGSQRTVMLGILTDIRESQIWNNKEVIRTIQVSGLDFTYFFSAFSYYQLTYLALIANQPLPSVAGYLLGQAGKNIIGTPDQAASYWFNFVMMGTDTTTNPTATACLQTTYVMYQGKQIFLHQLFSAWFEAFTEINAVYIPVYQDLLNAEGSWMDKFLAFLPFPYYEFFITTAETKDYASASAPSLSITAPGFPSVAPTLVARVNPLPWITYPIPGNNATSQLNNTRWNNLPTYSLGNFNFIESEVNYDTEEVANFLGVNTLFTDQITANSGNTNSNLFGFELLGGVIDHASINNFGFRPQFSSVRWMTLPSSVAAPASGTFDLQQVSQVMLGKLASYYIPTPSMLSGKMMMPLWPDILPGNKFLESPFKNTDVYEFYIEGVTHKYIYGGRSTTTLDLSRGLKLNDYNNPTTLIGLHLDTYAPVDGSLVARTDTSLNASAYTVNPATLGNLGLSVSPYYGSPPFISMNAKPVAPATGWPSGATNIYDDNFKAAAAACPALDWRQLKAQGIAESSLNQGAVSSAGAVGIMQIIPADYPMYDATLLKTDPAYNIMAGGQIMCGLISSTGSYNNALAHYIGGTNPDPANPTIRSYINTINRYALAAGVPNTT